MEWLSDPQIWIGLLTLTGLEIVLGIDNIVFISILSGRLRRCPLPDVGELVLMIEISRSEGIRYSPPALLHWLARISSLIMHG